MCGGRGVRNAWVPSVINRPIGGLMALIWSTVRRGGGDPRVSGHYLKIRARLAPFHVLIFPHLHFRCGPVVIPPIQTKKAPGPNIRRGKFLRSAPPSRFSLGLKIDASQFPSPVFEPGDFVVRIGKITYVSPVEYFDMVKKCDRPHRPCRSSVSPRTSFVNSRWPIRPSRNGRLPLLFAAPVCNFVKFRTFRRSFRIF